MYILYGCPETATFGPHAVLEEAGLPYTRELINTNTGGCRTPEYLAINPAGYVPALKLDDGTIMCEAAAIMLYLADKSGLPDLAPRVDEPQRAPFLRQLFYLTNTVQEAYKHYYYPGRYTTEESEAGHVRARALELLTERWQLVENDLAAGGPCVLGERYSMVDIYVAMLASWHPDPALFHDHFPAIRTCRDIVAARPRLKAVIEEHAV